MKTLPTLDELDFIDAAFFPCTKKKIAAFTKAVIGAHQASATLLDEIKKVDEADKQVLYKEAHLLDRDFCEFTKNSGLVLTWMTANKKPESELLARVVLKVFEHLLFLKQLHKKTFIIKAANQSS